VIVITAWCGKVVETRFHVSDFTPVEVVMVPSRKVLLVIPMTLAMLAVVLPVAAQTGSNLAPYKSFMKTASTNMSVGTSPVSGFSSTTVTCPASHAAGCTIRVEVSSQFAMACCMQGNFRIKLAISGAGSQIWPNSLVNVGMMGGGMMGYGDVFAHTFHWMKNGIPAGSTQTVSIQFQTDAGTGNAGYRIATIDCYLN
jgi:hypothetical protein